MPKAMISLSGGMDSATILGQLHGLSTQNGYDVFTTSFSYGSKHGRWETQAAYALQDFYKVPSSRQFEIGLPFIALFQSNLLINGGDIPEGSYEDKTMEKTVVPGRNMIFASILAGKAWSVGATEVWLGIHKGDHAIYPDCRPDWFDAMRLAVEAGTDHRVTLKAPFLHMTKEDILSIGYGLKTPVPYELTRTCYKNQAIACGKCGSCQERLEAFALLGKADPIEYESRELMLKKS